MSEPPAAAEATWYQAVELTVRGGEYAKPGPQVLAQLFFGDDHDPALLGDDDASFFARLFRQHTQLSPNQYRRQYQQKGE